MLEATALQRVDGQADGSEWVAKARRTVVTARAIAADDPESAFVLGYDAARYACTALLVHRGLRPTSRGGHYAVEQAMRAQFGDLFRPFGTLRRRRNQLEYPAYPGEHVAAPEVEAALAQVTAIIEAAARLLPEVGVF